MAHIGFGWDCAAESPGRPDWAPLCIRREAVASKICISQGIFLIGGVVAETSECDDHRHVTNLIVWYDEQPIGAPALFDDVLPFPLSKYHPGRPFHEPGLSDDALAQCTSIPHFCRCYQRRRSCGEGIRRRRRMTRTAFSVRPNRAASSASGSVPRRANSFLVQGRPPGRWGGRNPNSLAVRRRLSTASGGKRFPFMAAPLRTLRAVWSRAEPSLNCGKDDGDPRYAPRSSRMGRDAIQSADASGNGPATLEAADVGNPVSCHRKANL